MSSRDSICPHLGLAVIMIVAVHVYEPVGIQVYQFHFFIFNCSICRCLFRKLPSFFKVLVHKMYIRLGVYNVMLTT